MAVELNALLGIAVGLGNALYLDEGVYCDNDITGVGVIVQLARYKKCSTALDGAQFQFLHFLVFGKYFQLQRAAVIGDIKGDNGLFAPYLLEFRGKNIADHYYLLPKALYRLTNGSWLFADSSALDDLSRLCVKVLVKSSNIYGGSWNYRLHLLRPYLLGSLVGNELCAVIRHIRLDALYHLVKLLLAYGALSVKHYLDADSELIIYHP